ncbi:hypothetical protein MMC17_005688 [Xylographa soralifera]|nr:hypothetical protein [Xylographa soralifera]
MDPLTALGLAASVAQLIDFGSKIVTKSKEIAENGSSISVTHLSGITNDLVVINSNLEQQLGYRKVPGAGFTKEEQALHDLTLQCKTVAQELIDCLSRVTLDSHKKDKWATVRAAVKTIWSKDRIDSLANRLNDYREQLALRVLLLLNANNTVQGEKLDVLHTSYQEIVEVMSINWGYLKSTIEDHQQRRDQWHQEERVGAEKRHAETLAAILTTRDGNSRTITGPQCSVNLSIILSKHGNLQTATTYKQAIDSGNQFEHYTTNLETTKFMNISAQITTKILNALHFRSIADRHATIPKAYKRTFQWIYRDPESDQKSWDSLVEWLRSGKGCYWINGKAGSGKSTLMKYLHSEIGTKNCLNEWTGGSELVIGSYFFWYAGSSLQKSQAGLIRSLLFDILSQKQELVPVLFPEICRSILASQILGHIEFSFIELKKAFTTLVNSVPEGLKVFLLVDGLDEYEGDHNELSDLFSEATTSDSVKVLLSSRPIPSCVYAFSKCPKLRLQDLTYNDVEHYVREQIAGDPLMQKLEFADSGATLELINGITSKASGVFLWVILVVRRLISGLQDYDTRLDLLEKLEELPPDLERLYDHMLRSMSPQNRRQGSKLMQLVLRSLEIDADYPMTLLQLSFAEEEDYAKALESRVSRLSKRDEDWRCEAMEGRIRSRCCGLVEVHDHWTTIAKTRAEKEVVFLHRTVVEFIRSDTVWSQLISLTMGSMFDVNRALFSSSLAEAKAKPPLLEESPAESPALFSILRLLSYEECMETTAGLFHDVYLPELTNTIFFFWNDQSLFGTPEIEMNAMTASAKRGCARFKLSYPESFLLAAAIHCPKAYLHSLLTFFSRNSNSTLLSAYLLMHYVDERQVHVLTAISRNISSCGAEVNTAVLVPFASREFWNHRWKDALDYEGTYEWTLWDFALHHTLHVTKYTDADLFTLVNSGSITSFFDILITMLECGADANNTISVAFRNHSNQSWYEIHQLSAFAVLQQFMARVWNIAPGSADDLAQKLCRVEKIMKEKSASMWTRNIPRSVRSNSLVKRSEYAEKEITARNVKALEASEPIKSKKKGPEKAAGKARTEQRYFLEPKLEQESKAYPRKPFQAPDPSPWTEWNLRRQTATASANTSTSVSKPEEVQHPKRWESTPRDSRAKLLSQDKQELVTTIARTNPNARGRRLAFSRRTRLPFEQRSNILECSEALQQAQQASIGSDT